MEKPSVNLRLPNGELRSDYLCPVRYVVTNESKEKDLRVLTFPAQGRYTYETKEEAEEVLKLFEPSLRAKVLGDRADTLEVRGVPCWPGHHDPTRTVW